jgi:hypothetical protein
VALKSEFQPGFIVTTAGFQNIDDRPPEPAAAPAAYEFGVEVTS